jgi:sulfite exporter TauE/SafE
MNELLYCIVSGLAIGSLGSFHCIGMCGPIALSLPMASEDKASAAISIGLYNLGRAITYGLLGILFGLLGSQFRIWGVQQFVSILAGIVLLAFVLFHFKVRIPGSWFNTYQTKVRLMLQKLMTSKLNAGSFLLIGLLNGLLPCGLVYVAMVAALATGKIAMGGLLMFAFGVGTMPMMAGVMVFGRRISMRHRQIINKTIPYMVSIMACILILRGLNLGIPYVSPKMGESVKSIPSCHGESEESVFPVPK